MRKRIRNFLGIMIMTTAIVFSAIQLHTPVVKAHVCPSADAIGCNCMLTYGFTLWYNGEPYSVCTYLCGTCGGSGEPMYIEQTILVKE